jgi:hypothetical protein
MRSISARPFGGGGARIAVEGAARGCHGEVDVLGLPMEITPATVSVAGLMTSKIFGSTGLTQAPSI